MKLLVSDYDGTYNSDLGFPSTRAVNKSIDCFRKDGNVFVMATGRNFKSIKSEVIKYGIKYDYLICSNGSCIFDKDDNLIYSRTYDYDVCLKTLDILKKHDLIKKIYMLDAYGNETNDINKVCEIYTIINPFCFDKIKKLKKELEFLNVFKFLHIMTLTEKNDKKCAIDKLISDSYFDIDFENIYSIGNGSNDRTMIESYNGYKMILSERQLADTKAKRVLSVPSLVRKISGGK